VFMHSVQDARNLLWERPPEIKTLAKANGLRIGLPWMLTTSKGQLITIPGHTNCTPATASAAILIESG